MAIRPSREHVAGDEHRMPQAQVHPKLRGKGNFHHVSGQTLSPSVATSMRESSWRGEEVARLVSMGTTCRLKRPTAIHQNWPLLTGTCPELPGRKKGAARGTVTSRRHPRRPGRLRCCADIADRNRAPAGPSSGGPALCPARADGRSRAWLRRSRAHLFR